MRIGGTGDDGGRLARRWRLETVPNLAPWQDTLVRWSGALAGGLVLTIAYVPDRLVLTPQAFVAYLDSLRAAPLPTLEQVVVTALEDMNNQLVPRWVRASASLDQEGIHHHATVTDRQPGWNNPHLFTESA